MTTPSLKPFLSNTPKQPAAGKGMPAKDPKPQKPMTNRQPDASDGSAEDSLESPNDRDQATDMTSDQVDPHIRQAAKDLENGLQDTSEGLETDRAYKNL